MDKAVWGDKPKVMSGGCSCDERGFVSFVNGFDMPGIRRFYLIENHLVGMPRAWHGHRRERKWAYVVRGVARLACVSIEDLEAEQAKGSAGDAPTPAAGKLFSTTLSGRGPAIFYMPAGYANGCMALAPDTVIIHFSDLTVEESRGDDVRFPPTLFAGAWTIEAR